jgi:hypothetical protein
MPNTTLRSKSLFLLTAMGCAAFSVTRAPLHYHKESPAFSIASYGETLAATQVELLDAWILSLLDRPIFVSGRLPQWTLIFDPSWKKSAGYWANDLSDEHGRPAILVGPGALKSDIEAKRATLHELVHLMHNRFRPNEELWVREGIALFMEYRILRYSNPVETEAFVNPETTLIAQLNPHLADYPDVHRRNSEYGNLSLYFYYLYKECGGDELLNQLLLSPQGDSAKPVVGIPFINQVLGSRPSSGKERCSSFSQSFVAFQTAKFWNDPTQSELHVRPNTLEPTVRSRRAELPPYSGGAYTIKPPNEACATGDIPWGTDRCIAIRLN